MGEAFLIGYDYNLVEWKKWNCGESTGGYRYATLDEIYDAYPNREISYYVHKDSHIVVNEGAGYNFSSLRGFYGNGDDIFVSPASAAHHLCISTTLVTYILNSEEEGDFYYITEYVEDMAVQDDSSYYKGSSSYGSILSSENELPEIGYLIEGGANQNYCILSVNGTKYYYEKV